jgi:hypothetical protein
MANGRRGGRSLTGFRGDASMVYIKSLRDVPARPGIEARGIGMR